MGNSLQIPNLQTESNYLDSFDFYWIFTNLGGPLGVGGWGWGWVWATPCTCARARACTHVHARAYDIIGNSQWDIPMGAAICMKLSCLYAYMRVCMCMRIHMCVGVAPTHPHPHPPTHPPLRGGNTQNSEISICLDLIEIIRFCLKILYLWTLLNSSRLTLITLDTPTHLPRPPGAKEAEILKML